MISKLFTISQKKERRIIGLMSGTSLDGLDIALCRIQNSGRQTNVIVEHFITIPYPTPLVREIREISSDVVSLAALCKWNTQLGDLYGTWINECLDKWKVSASEIDLIASHGQTIFHQPRPSQGDARPSTFQIGDGDQLARQTGIITISDFRMKHIAAGGEGAPLAGYGDYLLFAEDDKDVVLLNIGGISNFTWIPKNKESALICSDIGAGNVLLDAWMRKHSGNAYDKNGELAAKGKVNEALLNELKDHPFHLLPFPKTTGPEEFNYQFIDECIRRAAIMDISNEDAMATLTCYTALIICESLSRVGLPSKFDLFISGGGLKNATFMRELKFHLPGATIRSTEEKNIFPDAKEAVLFALLSNECVAGTNGTFTGTGLLDVRMGKISFPD